MKCLLLTLTLLVMAGSAFAAGGKDVAYKSGDETVKAVLYMPQGKGPFPALRGDSRVVGPDAVGGRAGGQPRRSGLRGAGHRSLSRQVDDIAGGGARVDARRAGDRTIRDLKAAFNYLVSRKDVDAKRIGAIGWCMGGGYALDLTVSEPRLAASVINYGHLATERSTLDKIRHLFWAFSVDRIAGFPRQRSHLCSTTPIARQIRRNQNLPRRGTRV